MKKLIFTLSVLAILLFSCNTVADSSRNSEEIRTIHGFIVHKKISNWVLTKERKLNKDGSDVGYNFRNNIDNTLKGTITIYPRKINIDEKYLQQELSEQLSVAKKDKKYYKLLLADIGIKKQGNKEYPSAFAVFNYKINNVPLTSYIVIVHVNEWTVLYRISYRQGIDEKVKEEVQKMLTDIKYM